MISRLSYVEVTGDPEMNSFRGLVGVGEGCWNWRRETVPGYMQSFQGFLTKKGWRD